MGKTKHSKNKKKHRHRPTGLVDVQEAEKNNTENDDMREKTLPILEKLNCLEDRRHACAGLASLVSETEVIPQLMKHDLVQRVAPLVLDKDEATQETACGVLRNLSISGAPEICQAMVDQDVMTPITHYIKELSQHLSIGESCESLVEKQTTVLEQVLHLLLSLCENSGDALEIINKECIPVILVSFLNIETIPMQNCLITAHCLCTITEDNQSASKLLVSSEKSLAILEKVLLHNGENEQSFLLKVLTAGILYNISSSLPAHKTFEMFQTIASIFSKVLSCDAQQYLEQKFCEMTESDESENTTNVVKENEAERFFHLLEAQKVVLEILTNMCCSHDCSDWDENNEECVSSDDDIGNEHNMEIQMESSHLPEEILTSIVQHEIPKKVLQKCSFTKLDSNTVLMSTKRAQSCIKIASTIQTRALLCLNNIVTCVDLDHLGGIEAVQFLWKTIMGIAVENNGCSTSGFTRSDDEFVEAASCALRSVLEKLSTTSCQCVTVEQVNLLCYLSNMVKHEAAKVNFMNVLGIVGKMVIASSSENKVEPLQCIGTVLRGVIASDEGLWVIAEALDAIFDIFADSAEADVAASQIHLFEQLDKTGRLLKSRMKKDRHNLGERYSIVDTARANLMRFLKYKKQS